MPVEPLLLHTVGSPLRAFVRLAAGAYYSRIEIENPGRIPPRGPVLLVANHPNSLLDPVLVGRTARRPVHFLAKAPLFEVPVFGLAMKAFGMLPAYRASDRSDVKQNVKSLEAAAEYLARGEAVGIFPEGTSHDLARVEAAKTGAARIAFQAVALGAKGLLVVPIGLNYEAKERFRSAVWIRVGPPLAVDDWVSKHPDDPHRGIRELTHQIESSLREQAIHLADKNWGNLLDFLEAYYSAGQQDGVAEIKLRKQIADAMNFFAEKHPPQAEELARAVQEHHAALVRHGLPPGTELLEKSFPALIWSRAWRCLHLALWSLPALAGTLFHLVPFLVVRGIAARLQYPGRITTAFTRLAVGIPLYAAWYAGMAVWMLPRVPLAALWAGLVLMPPFGILALGFWSQGLALLRQSWRETKLLRQRHRLCELRSAHTRIAEQLAGVLDGHPQETRGASERPDGGFA